MDYKELKIGESYQKAFEQLRYQKMDSSESMFPSIKDLTPQYAIPQEVLKNLMPDWESYEISAPPFAEHMEKTEQYQKQSLEILQAISDNTASLQMIVDLIAKSNDKQDDMLQILTETLSIAKAKDTEEAGALYKKVVERINTTVTTGESMAKIITVATALYNAVQLGLV